MCKERRLNAAVYGYAEQLRTRLLYCGVNSWTPHINAQFRQMLFYDDLVERCLHI